MSFFISDAVAAAPGASSQGDMWSMMFFMGLIFVLFYFMLIRPQQKRIKEQREMMGKLKKGDEIITIGGLVAKILSVDEQYLKVVPCEGTEFLVQKTAVSTVLPKGTIKSL